MTLDRKSADPLVTVATRVGQYCQQLAGPDSSAPNTTARDARRIP